MLRPEDIQPEMLRLEDVGKGLGGKTVVHSASFRVAAGEILCITGESGIGKSTLLELVAGVIKPDKGLIQRNGAVSLCFQDNALIPWLSAAANLDYVLPAGPESPGGHGVERSAHISGWLERFGLSGDIFPAAMSGGMRRRLGLARAFAVQRPILLLDEPFAFLDEGWQSAVSACIAEAAAGGAAVVLTSHTLDPVRSLPIVHKHADNAPLSLNW